MTSLYKYLPKEFAEDVLNKGDLLFRNLTYFRQCEGRIRGDPWEGIHKDHPGTEVTLKNLTRGGEMRGAYALLHSTDPDHIFVFCLSKNLDNKLVADFSATAVIEIFDPAELIRRVQFKLRRVLSIHSYGVMARPVVYYKPDEPALLNVEDPRNLAFVKNEIYRYQSEFRLVFGTRRAFRLIQQIAMPHHDPYEEAIKKQALQRLVTIGSISDIAKLVPL
jgi:hypothetical protein